jgi:hypothetical protein
MGLTSRKAEWRKRLANNHLDTYASETLGKKKGNIMRTTTIMMMICAWLVASGTILTYGNEKTPTEAESQTSRTFTVLNYGAVGDDKSDNSEAFSACLKAVIEAGGGRMHLPDGVYRGRIIIPGTKKWITVEIAGESEPTPVFGTIGTIPLQKNGTIIKCVSKSGPAVLSAANSPEKLYMTFSGVSVIIRNLDVRTYDNPGISGIDLKHYGLLSKTQGEQEAVHQPGEIS